MRRLAPIFCLAASVGALAEPLTLPQIIERAKKTDVRVKEAEADLHKFEALASEAKWAWFPKFDSNILVAGPTPEAVNDGLGGPPATAATIQYDTNFGHVGVMLGADSQALLPLWTFGKLTALREAGEQGVIAGENLKVRAEDQAAYDAAEAYWGYQLARESRIALDDTAKRLDDARTTLQKLLDQQSPQVSKLDLFKLDFYRKQLEARRGQIEAGSGLAQRAIRLLLAMGPNEKLEIAAEDLPNPEWELKPIDWYVDRAAEKRPELKAIDAGVEAMARQVYIREKMFLPDFGLAGFVRWRWTTSATRQLSPFAYDPYNDLSGGVGLVGHITFDVPQKTAQLDQARADLEKIETQREELRAGIRLEIEKVYGGVADSLVRARAQTDGERAAKRWAQGAFTNFDVGTGDLRELTDAFTALAIASAEKMVAYHDAQVGMRALAKAAAVAPDDVPLK